MNLTFASWNQISSLFGKSMGFVMRRKPHSCLTKDEQPSCPRAYPPSKLSECFFALPPQARVAVALNECGGADPNAHEEDRRETENFSRRLRSD